MKQNKLAPQISRYLHSKTRLVHRQTDLHGPPGLTLSLDLSRGSRSLSALSRGRPRLAPGAAAADL